MATWYGGLMTKKNETNDDARWTSELKPAPGDLRLLQAFLNTGDRELDSPQAFADWLELWGLMAPGIQLEQRDLERTIEVREATRTLFARAPAVAVDAAAARLDEAMAVATMRARFGTGGRIRLEPASGGLDGALARLCALLAEAQFGGTGRRLKICGARNCGAAFFDDSKNRARKWCSPRCGSRVTSMNFRRRNLEEVRKRERLNVYRRRSNAAQAAPASAANGAAEISKRR